MNRRGQMIPRGDRKWLLRVFLGRDGEGKKKYASKIILGTTAQARQELTKFLRDSDTHSVVQTSKHTLASFVQDWYATKVKIRESTLNGYKTHLDLYILPHLGQLRLVELTSTRVQAAYNALIEQKLSPRTIEYAHTVLHQVLEKAIELGFLLRNPTTHTERPDKVERDLTILSPQQMVALFKSEQGKRLHTLWLLMLNTGLRPGEALALRWCDLENGSTLRVKQVLERKADGSYQLTERKAKTKKSLRPVTLPSSVVEALKGHRQTQAREMLAAGERYERNDFIFATKAGAFLDPNNVRNRFKSALKRAGLPADVRLYDTRHSHATALLNQGKVPLAFVAARLGHSSVRVTEQVYARVLPEAHHEMADTMETILQKAAHR